MECWESLQRVPRSDVAGISQPGSIRFSDSLSLDSTSGYRLQRLACEHLHSYAGPDEAAKNRHVRNNGNKILTDWRRDRNGLAKLW